VLDHGQSRHVAEDAEGIGGPHIAIAVNVAAEVTTRRKAQSKAGDKPEVLQGIDSVHASVAVDVSRQLTPSISRQSEGLPEEGPLEATEAGRRFAG
jgi:hypothetical protein